MLFKATICAAAIAAPAFADPVINCDDAEAYHRFFLFQLAVTDAVVAGCKPDMTQPACKAFIEEFQSKAPPPDSADGLSSFIAFMREQCPGKIPSE